MCSLYAWNNFNNKIELAIQGVPRVLVVTQGYDHSGHSKAKMLFTHILVSAFILQQFELV